MAREARYIRLEDRDSRYGKPSSSTNSNSSHNERTRQMHDVWIDVTQNPREPCGGCEGNVVLANAGYGLGWKGQDPTLLEVVASVGVCADDRHVVPESAQLSRHMDHRVRHTIGPWEKGLRHYGDTHEPITAQLERLSTRRT